MTIPPIRLALGKHLGQVLTPELAYSIEFQAAETPNLTLAPEKFGTQEYAGYLIQVELLSAILPELHRLHEMQFQETERHRAGISLSANYDYMRAQERAGRMLQFTARDAATQELIGNMRMYLYQDLHAGLLCCKEDTFYVLPAHRGGFLSIRLCQFAERALVSIGVREIYLTTKFVNRASSMAKYLKFKPVATEHVKIFDEAGKPVSLE